MAQNDFILHFQPYDTESNLRLMASRRILFLAFPGHQLLDVTGPLQMFAGANDELGSQVYDCQLAATRTGAVRSSSGLELVATRVFSGIDTRALRAVDTLVALGGSGVAIAEELSLGAISALVRKAPGRVRRIASVCAGAFFLADAGVLDGRRAATHWASAEALKRFRPAVEVDPDPIFICDPPLYTSAGVTAGIDLALAMIEEDHGRAVALAVARRHVVFRMRPGGQAQFSSELAAQGCEDRRLERLARAVRDAPGADWRVQTLTEAAGVSPRTLSRLFRAELGTTPAGFVERVRVDAARDALLESDQPIEAIADACGFGSIRRLDRAFARTLGTPPREFRRRFHRPSGHMTSTTTRYLEEHA